MTGKLLLGLCLGIVLASAAITAWMDSDPPTASASSPPDTRSYAEPSLGEEWRCIVIIMNASVEGSNLCSPYGWAHSQEGGGTTQGGGTTPVRKENATGPPRTAEAKTAPRYAEGTVPRQGGSSYVVHVRDGDIVMAPAASSG